MKDNGWEKHAAAVSVSGILHLVKEGGSECGFQLQDIVAANRFKGKYSTVPSHKLLFFSLNLNGLHYKSSMVTALVASDRRLLSFQDEVILLFPNPDVETHNCSKLCLEEKFTSIGRVRLDDTCWAWIPHFNLAPIPM